MQTKIIALDDENQFQDELNLSIRQLIKSGNLIVDIKFSTSSYAWGDVENQKMLFSALIMYKEEANNDKQ